MSAKSPILGSAAAEFTSKTLAARQQLLNEPHATWQDERPNNDDPSVERNPTHRVAVVEIDGLSEIESTLFGLVELVLKNRPRLERMIRDRTLQPQLVPRFLAIALVAFTLYGVAMATVLSSAGVWPSLTAISAKLDSAGRNGLNAAAGLIEFLPLDDGLLDSPWWNGAAAILVAAYSLGLIAASGICLPSLYFYGLLSGVRMTMLDVTVHTLKAKAVSATALIGILPIYAALALGVVIFPFPETLLHGALLVGLILPFIAGLWGVRSLSVGFVGLVDTMPAEFRCRRECFLRRLVFSWSAVYTAVTPVMIFTLWEYLAR
jgi:hypothetical protein